MTDPAISPSLPAFIASAEALLRDRVLVATEGDTRFAGLMVASALGMARRELELVEQSTASARDVAGLVPQPSPFPSDGQALVHLIRAGMLDGAQDAFRRLYTDAIIRTAITRPAVVSDTERSLAGLE